MSRKKLIFFFFISIYLFSFSRDITLEESIDLVLNNSKDIKISEIDLKIAKISFTKAIKTALPSVTYTTTYNQNEFDRNVARDKNHFETQKYSYNQSLKITQPLFHGGAIIKNISNAKSFEKIANYNFLLKKIDSRLDIIKIYSDILNSEKNLEILDNSEKILKKLYDKQKVQLDLRLITKTELLKTEYSLLQIESQKISLKNTLNTYYNDFYIKTGLPKNEDLKLLNFEILDNLTSKINLDNDLKQGLEESILSKISDENLKISKNNASIAAGQILPSVDIFASYGGAERTNFENSYKDASWSGGLQFSWNIFSFGEDLDNYRIKKLEADKEEINENLYKEKLEVEIKNQYYNLLKLEKIKESSKKALEVAENNFKLDEERYSAGIISITDYLNSENSYREASAEYNKTLFDYYYSFEKYRSLLI